MQMVVRCLHPLSWMLLCSAYRLRTYIKDSKVIPSEGGQFEKGLWTGIAEVLIEERNT